MNRLFQFAAILGFLLAAGCKTTSPDQPTPPPNPYGALHTQVQPGGLLSITNVVAKPLKSSSM